MRFHSIQNADENRHVAERIHHEEQKKRRESVVADSRAKEKNKKSAHEELFSKVKKTAAEGPAEKPVRDIDFD